MSNIIPFKVLSSEWSFAQYRIPPETKSICCFGQDNNINVITYDGNFHIANIDVNKGGECIRKESYPIMETK